MRRLLTLPQEAPRATLALLAAITIGFAFFAARIDVDAAAENMLPADDPERTYFAEIRETFGSEEVTLIGVFADDVFTPSTIAKIDRLSRDLQALDGVAEVLSLTTVQGAELTDFGLETGRLMKKLPATQEEANAFREAVFRNPLYLGTMVSRDSRAAGISVVFEPMSDRDLIRGGYEQRLRDRVAAMEGPEETAITGIPTLKVFGARYLQEDMRKFLPLSILWIVAMLAWTYRSVRGVLVPISTVLVGVIWTTGLMVITGTTIKLGTVVLAPLLVAIGVAYSIHMMSRYYDEIRPERDKKEVIDATLEHIRLPVAVAALTTLAGFSTFVFIPIPAIREFGLFAMFGLVAIVVASFAIVPASMTLLSLPVGRPKEPIGHGLLTRLPAWLGELSIRNGRAVLLLAIAASGLAIWGITSIRVEMDFISLFDPNGPVRQDNELLASRLAGTQTLSIVVEGKEAQSLTRIENVRAIRALQDFVDAQADVDKTISFVDTLEQARRVIDPEADPFPDSQDAIGQILLLINPEDLRSVLNASAMRANMIVRSRLSGSVEVGAFVDAVQRFAAENLPAELTVRPTGSLVLLNRSSVTVAVSQVRGLWQVFAVILVLMCVMFLSVRVGCLSLIPNIFPVLMLFGVMGWLGIPLNSSTTLIAAISVGIAIDDTLHYLGAFSSELRRTGDQNQAMLNAARTVGAPIVVTSLALAGAFLIVALSNFGSVRDFGKLASMTMVIALVSDLILTPAVLMSTKIITLWDLMYLKLGPDPQKQIPLFTGLSNLQAKIVVLMARLTEATRDSLITRAGEKKEEMYVLLSGRAEVRRGATRLPLARGDVIGEMGLVRGQPRSADVVALDDLEYLVLDRTFLQRIRRRYPRIGNVVLFNLARILSDRLDATTGDLARAANRTTTVTPGKETA